MKNNTIKGIIYRIYSSGQSDKVINIIDNEGSKVTLLAKGAKKNNSKKAHSIELANQIEVKIVEGYAIPIISEIKVVEEFILWKKDQAGILFIQLFCEVIDKLCYENNKDTELYTLLFNCLNEYNINTLSIANSFLLKIIWHSGAIQPININALTGESLDVNGVIYTNQIAGYISKSELQKNLELSGEQVSQLIPKGQKYLLEKPYSLAKGLALSLADQLKMLQINLDWFEIITEQRLKSKGIILSLVGKLNKKL